MKLREWRERKGWTQERLAARLGVSEASVSRLESGHQRPTLGLIIKLHAVTRGRVKPHDFFEEAAP